jgi:uncharacterized protein YcbX
VPGRLKNIFLYPLKAARGMVLPSATVEPWGLAGDRRWALVDDRRRRIDVVSCPPIMTITPRPKADGGLELTAPGHSSVVVTPPGPDAPRIEIESFGVDLPVVTDPTVNDWLAAVLGRPAHLLRPDDPKLKMMAEEDGGRDADVVSLAHAAPLLLTSTGSLRRLDRWIADGLAERDEPALPSLNMLRFRPNVVVDSFDAFAEDDWRRVTIGEISFRVAAPCYRCAVTLADPDTLSRGKEPLRTLARHRRHGKKLHFGIWLVPENHGDLQVGNDVVPG